MNTQTKDLTIHTRTNEYQKDFWNIMHGSKESYNKIEKYRDTITGTFPLPKTVESTYVAELAKRSLFRRIGTVINALETGYRIFARDSNDLAQWVPEGDSLPLTDGMDDFTNMPVDNNKLGTLLKLNESFVNDASFDLESHLITRFAKAFGKAEDSAFITGNGTTMPTGLLHATAGAQEALTAASLTYANVTELYLSLKKEYRGDGVWLMNDETALVLRTLKDEDGNHLWRESDDSIFGKPVQYSEFMPDIETGTMPILFGDFSYYWVIDRKLISVTTLFEHFIRNNQIGYLGFEFLDGKLIRREAIKGIKIVSE
mgnify:CR=1 FL=1